MPSLLVPVQRVRSFLAHTPFERVQSLDAELHQLGLLRVLTGIVCLVRTIPMVWTSAYYYEPPDGGGLPDATVRGLWMLGLIAANTLGIATPASSAALVFLYPSYDNRLNAESLGTRVLTLLLGLFFLARGGARVSLDERLLRGRGPLSAPVRALYNLVGVPSVEQLRVLYLLFFVAFATMNFGALVYHAQDDAWRSGQLLRVVFTSSYLCRFWTEWRAVEAFSPRVLAAISVLGACGQAVYQGLMVPLIWTRWGARFIIWWGALFFALSLLFLQLSYLPALEIILWIALFHRPASGDSRPPEILAPFIRSPRRAARIAAACFALVAVFAAIEVPYAAGWIEERSERFRRIAQGAGLEIPEVFNRDDLRMGDAWPVLFDDDTGRLLPYHGRNGERLTWVQWSDLLYFGNSLRWRREFRSVEDLTREHAGFYRVVDAALFDHRRRGVERSAYRVEYFQNEASNLGRPAPARFQPRRIGVDRFVCTGTGRRASCK